MTKARKRKATKKQKIYAIIGLVAVAIVLVLFITKGIPMIKSHKNSAYNSKYVYDGISLVGRWQEAEDFDNSFYKIYDFKTGGKVVTSIYVYGIEAVRDELSTYRVEDKNTLIITYTINGNPQNSEVKFSISEDMSKLVLRDGGKNTVLEKFNLEYNKDDSIFGEWKNSDGGYTFNADYTGKVNDTSKTNNTVFSTKNNTLYLFIDENLIVPDNDYGLSEKYVLEYKYEIKGDTLTLTDAAGDKTEYQRSK